MALKVKVGLIGAFDMLKFKNMAKTREKAIQSAPAKEISGEFKINQNAKALHPDYQQMVIDEIIDHKGANCKTFVFKKQDGSPAAFFRAGQYLSLLIKKDGAVTTRPYSICSSPMLSKEGKYAITVQSNPGGFVAEWMMDTFKVGDKLTVSEPLGHYYYDDLRDEKQVIALAGGSGLTPFLSMAYAIRDGLEDFDLTIIFGNPTEESILMKAELDALQAECPRIKVVHVLSDEEKEGYEHGFITADIVKKYAPENYSVFVCGPEPMYRFLFEELKKLNLDKKHLRYEMLGVTKSVWEQDGYPIECKDKVFKLTVKQCGEEYVIDASANEPLLVAIERSGITAPSRCRSGDCAWCRSKLISGSVHVSLENDNRRWADIEYGYIHPCCSFPTSDVVLDVPGSYVK